MSSLKNTCFQNNMCAETTLGEFAISLVLVISCQPVNVETEISNFSDLEVQRVSGFPQALENLEKSRKKFHAWKNH